MPLGGVPFDAGAPAALERAARRSDPTRAASASPAVQCLPGPSGQILRALPLRGERGPAVRAALPARRRPGRELATDRAGVVARGTAGVSADRHLVSLGGLPS